MLLPWWIGEIPKWVQDHWYFKALCKDGSITAIVSTKDKDIDQALKPQIPDQSGKDVKAIESSKNEKSAGKPSKSAQKTDDPPKSDDGGENPDSGDAK